MLLDLLRGDKAYTVSWLPPAYPAGIYDKVYLNYYATCRVALPRHTIQQLTSIVKQISLVEMKPGLAYTAAIFASNVLGIGVPCTKQSSLPGQGNINVMVITVIFC